MTTRKKKIEKINAFLGAISKHPEIWDPKNDYYKNKEIKNQVWEQLAEDFDFEGCQKINLQFT